MKNMIFLSMLFILSYSFVFSQDWGLTNDLVYVQGGSFIMGDVEGDQWEMASPPHQVTITYDFYIDAYMITYGEWMIFCENSGIEVHFDTNADIRNEPVSNISWYDAIEYCNWLSESVGLPVAYDESTGDLLDINGMVTTNIQEVKGIRLPTEAEWEWAAGGGLQGEDTEFAGSDDPDTVAWHWHNSGGETQPVGLLEPNELGLYDMSGNLFEWCNDWFKKYSAHALVNPIGPVTGDHFPYDSSTGEHYKMIKGGAALANKDRCPIEDRDHRLPSKGYSHVGMRIALTASE